jgi:hypothetical protein
MGEKVTQVKDINESLLLFTEFTIKNVDNEMGK